MYSIVVVRFVCFGRSTSRGDLGGEGGFRPQEVGRCEDVVGENSRPRLFFGRHKRPVVELLRSAFYPKVGPPRGCRNLHIRRDVFGPCGDQGVGFFGTAARGAASLVTSEKLTRSGGATAFPTEVAQPPRRFEPRRTAEDGGRRDRVAPVRRIGIAGSRSEDGP